MNIINLSLDQSLFDSKKIGDTHDRFVAYSKFCDSFTVIIPTTKNFQSLKKDSINYIPTNGRNVLFAFINLYFELSKLLAKQSKAIIIANDPILGFISLLAKIRYKEIKIQINSFGTRLNQLSWVSEKSHYPLLWFVTLISLKFADSVRCDTQADKKIIQKYVGDKEEKFIVLPVPPSSEIQKNLLSFPSKTKFSNPIKILAVGSLTKNKDFPTLIQALAKVPKELNFNLSLIGSGPEENNIKALINDLSLGDRINPIQNITYSDLLKSYRDSDILVSSSKIEGLPRVLQEAALAGLPIITTNFNGAHDFVQNNKTGLVVDIGDVNQLALAITTYLKNSNLAFTHSIEARKFAKKYCNFKNIVLKLVDSWKELEKRV